MMHPDIQHDMPRGLKAPIAIVMISLNEAHNMEAVLENISGFAQEIFLVDSVSSDATVDIALRYGVHVVQRRFSNFGDQWNFALEHLPITAPWTMKLDPDERLTDELKASILGRLNENGVNGFTMIRNLWFMGRPLGVRQNILRIWRTGTCRFSAVLVNEHPIVPGRIDHLSGHLEHHDSPNLHHWLEKQNAYTTAEAFGSWREDKLSAPPRLFGSRLSRRMWFKQNFQYMPFRYLLMMAYCYLVEGAWRAGRVGRIWSKLRADVYRFHAYKLDEMRLGNQGYGLPPGAVGTPDPRVPLYERVESSAVQAAETSPAVAYHDQLAEKWDQRYITGGFRRRADFILKEVLPSLPFNGHWLDVGCGTAYFGRILARRGGRVLGVDGSEKMLREALKLAEVNGLTDRMSFHAVANVEHLPYAEQEFDHVLCLSVLEYLSNPTQCIREISRIAKPGGTVLVSVPNKYSFIRRAQRFLYRLTGRRSRLSLAYLDSSLNSWSAGKLIRTAAHEGIIYERMLCFDPVIPRWLWRLLPPSMLFFVGRRVASGPATAS